MALAPQLYLPYLLIGLRAVSLMFIVGATLQHTTIHISSSPEQFDSRFYYTGKPGKGKGKGPLKVKYSQR